MIVKTELYVFFKEEDGGTTADPAIQNKLMSDLAKLLGGSEVLVPEITTTEGHFLFYIINLLRSSHKIL
jgi:hypothetical protein